MELKSVCTGYENQGICVMCGGELCGRRTVYCSGKCRDLYFGLFFWASASRQAIRRCNRKCQRCGVTEDGLSRMQRRNRWGVSRDVFRLRLEVHHIEPINGQSRTWHALNIPGNLRVVCHDCHVLIHTPSYWKAQERRQMQPSLV